MADCRGLLSLIEDNRVHFHRSGDRSRRSRRGALGWARFERLLAHLGSPLTLLGPRAPRSAVEILTRLDRVARCAPNPPVSGVRRILGE
jgi:hypothetical protein